MLKIRRTLSLIFASLFISLAAAGCAHIPGHTFSSDVLFAFGSAQLTPSGQLEVDRVAADLRTQKNVKIDVVGHTDRIGDVEANRTLSLRRAEAVRNRLLRAGMSPEQVQAYGVGASKPVVECDQRVESELIACLAPNRRVDISVSR